MATILTAQQSSETTSGAIVPPSFEAFFAENEASIRRALSAGFGPELGKEAAAEALAYGWQFWDRVGPLDNPAGYLYRVGKPCTEDSPLARPPCGRSPSRTGWLSYGI